MKEIIGFIGQGFIGKNYADDFEERGYTVVRYGEEDEYIANKKNISKCDIVFVAVPTPTTQDGFDCSIVRSVVDLVGKGKIVVIKSTMLPGSTRVIQELYPDRFVLHSPEFLSRATVVDDTRRPNRNIIGVPIDSSEYRDKANIVLKVLPKALYTLVTKSDESELIKYVNNTFFYTKIVFMNLLYEMSEKHECSWERIKEAIEHEPWIGNMHIDPVHRSGRGAGGPCLVKDFKAFLDHYHEYGDDPVGSAMLTAIEKKNMELLTNSEKDVNIINEIYGEV